MEVVTGGLEVELRKSPEAEDGREEGEVMPCEFPQRGMSGEIEWINGAIQISAHSVPSETQRLQIGHRFREIWKGLGQVLRCGEAGTIQGNDLVGVGQKQVEELSSKAEHDENFQRGRLCTFQA